MYFNQVTFGQSLFVKDKSLQGGMRSYERHNEEHLGGQKLTPIVTLVHTLFSIVTHELICSSPRCSWVCKDSVFFPLYMRKPRSFGKDKVISSQVSSSYLGCGGAGIQTQT